MKERVLLVGSVTEVDFPNKGKLMPTGESPEIPEENPAGICFIQPTREYGPLHIKNVLPGQKWLVSTRVKGRFSKQATPIKLLEKAPYEIEAPCPHADNCGGCSYQSVPYEDQLKLKEAQVKKLLLDIPGIWKAMEEGRFLPIHQSPLKEGYRNKMEFSFGDEVKGGELTLGLHKRGAFHDILSTPGCRLIHPDMQVLVRETEAFFHAEKTPYYHSYSKEGILRHLVLRRSFAEEQILVNLVTTSKAVPELIGRYKEFLLGLSMDGQISGILHTVNDSVADVVRADEVKLLYGKDYLIEKLLGLTFKIFPFSFFQTNTKGAEVLYQIVRDFAGDVSSKEVFDLYCGTGTIAQIMAAAGAKSVQGIELVEEAVTAAKENAERNGLSNCPFIAGDVLKLVESLDGKPDLIILDPPRDGIHPKAMPKLLAYQPKQFIYVSCKPTSLVRDLPFMLEAGYRIEKITCCDMFPSAVHCEVVVSLVRDEGK